MVAVQVAPTVPHAQTPLTHLRLVQQSESTSHAPAGLVRGTQPVRQNPATQVEPEQQSPSIAQGCVFVRHGLVHVPCGHPSPLQHSFESVQVSPDALHAVGTLQNPPMHEKPVQHVFVVHG